MSQSRYVFAAACPTLLVAACDALRIEPCKKKFPCLNKNERRGNILKFIQMCWKLVPESARAEISWRLQVCHFAGDTGYMNPAMWPTFRQYFDGNVLLSEQIHEQFDQWQEKKFRTRQSPEKTILRILNLPAPLIFEAAAYILEPVGQEAAHQIGQCLQDVLQGACSYLRFGSAHVGKQELEIQFSQNHPIEYRRIEAY